MLAQVTVNSGDTAWVLISAGLVLFMTPGLAFFYAGMVRGRNTLVMLQQNFIPLGVVSLTWVLVGYTIAFGNDVGGGLLGGLGNFGLTDLQNAPPPGLHVVSPGVAIPVLAFAAYQMMFAVITPALATGAVADRMKFAGWALFLAIWSIVVYAPIAHWLWAPAGWLTQLGAQDWAGGMVVHASAGAAALALLIVLGKRKAWPNNAPLPHSIPLVIVGAGILWFGWFGFNAGDGLQADGVAAQALVNTHIAACAGMLVWLFMEWRREGHPTVLGAVTGAVAGLATITPAAGYVSTISAIGIGIIAGFVCHLALKAKVFFQYDDALDVIAVHFIGGVLGSVLVGFFGEAAINGIGADGLFYGGGATLLGYQLLAVASVVAFSLVLSWLIAMGVEKTIGLRVDPADEDSLDLRQQGMDAYHFSRVAGLGGRTDVASERPKRHVTRTDADLALTTALLDIDAVDMADLEAELVAKGATTIIVSEANVYEDQGDERVVRGERRVVDLPYRLRVEVVSAKEDTAAVLETLEQYTSKGSGGFVHAVGRR